MAFRHNAPNCWSAPVSPSEMLLVLPVLSLNEKNNAALPHLSTNEPILFYPCWATVCIPKNTVIHNEPANAIMKTPTVTEIGYASSQTAISYIMLLFSHLALSISRNSQPLTICTVGEEENCVTFLADCTYLTFGFWWRKASASPWKCFRSHRTPPAPCGEQWHDVGVQKHVHLKTPRQHVIHTEMYCNMLPSMTENYIWPKSVMVSYCMIRYMKKQCICSVTYSRCYTCDSGCGPGTVISMFTFT